MIVSGSVHHNQCIYVFLDNRREKNNCRLCFSADAVADVKLSGPGAAGNTKVNNLLFFTVNGNMFVI